MKNKLYIGCELIVPFQLKLKILTHVISQKKCLKLQVFHLNEHKCVKKKTFC